MAQLLEHPWLFALSIICGLSALGMTYEFILRLFGRKGLCTSFSDDASSEEQTDEDEKNGEYVYKKNPDRHLWNDWADKNNKESEN